MELTQKQQIQGYRRNTKLLDGQQIVIRTITPYDKESLISFHSRLSDETRFLRFLYAKKELTEKDLKDFCDIDYKDNVGLVAERGKKGKQEIIGVGRLCRLADGSNTAEVAFVVQDDEQRKGIGTLLLKHLAMLAWDLDVYFFLGELFRENARMLSIFRKADPEMYQAIDDDSTCVVKLSVSEIMFNAPC